MSMPGRAAILLALGTALAVGAAGCSSGPSEGALAGKSATSVTSISVTAFHRQISVHFVTKTVIGSQTTVEIGATSKSAAEETIRSGHTPVLQAIYVDKVAYVRAGTQFLENDLHLSSTTAAAHAGKWISIQKGDTSYSNIVQSLAPGGAIIEFVPEEPNLKVAGATQFSGRGAVAVQGSPGGGVPQGSSAATTLFVSTAAPYLPLGATVELKNSQTGKTEERVASVFGKWNEHVDPVPPKGAISLSSIA